MQEAERIIADLISKGARSRQAAVYEARGVYAQLIAMAVAGNYPVLPGNVDGYRYCAAEYSKCLGVNVGA